MIEEYFRHRNRPMRENNRLQALVPTRGDFIHNYNGTAPGLIFDNGTKVVIALPGPRTNWSRWSCSRSSPFFGSAFGWRTTASPGSCSSVERVSRMWIWWYVRWCRITPDRGLLLAHLGIIELTLSIRRQLPSAAETLSHIIDSVKNEIGEYIFSEQKQTGAARG